MIPRCVGVVMPEGHAQMPLLERNDLDDDDGEVVIEGEVIDVYPF